MNNLDNENKNTNTDLRKKNSSKEAKRLLKYTRLLGYFVMLVSSIILIYNDHGSTQGFGFYGLGFTIYLIGKETF